MDYKIIWKGTDGDFYPKRKNSVGEEYKPEVHVIHIMQGTLSGTDSHFNNPKVQASTHYGIGKNGEIHQYVKCEDAAWGNGFLTNPNWEYQRKHPGVNPNLYTLSYELEGNTGDVPTKEQFNALIYLLKLNSKAYNIPFTKDRFIGHFIIDPVNRPNCPGKGFPWNGLYKELGIDAVAVDYSTVVTLGSKGQDVTRLQKLLNEKGYKVAIDGDCGQITFRAIVTFQRDNKLVADGICGPMTWSKLV